MIYFLFTHRDHVTFEKYKKNLHDQVELDTMINNHKSRSKLLISMIKKHSMKYY